ncbi:A24 family peptidase [Pseudomonas sp. Je.1.5.c]|uniref:prepilin peptidase n=1 Tax=Pseudomonas sp. Je.1.5.c TaxID=3142839 RepID=UPI003DA943D6
MIDWEFHSGLMLTGTGLLGLVAGQLLTHVAHQLPISLEHQWQQEAREVLGLGKEVTCLPKHGSHDTSRPRDWVVQIGCAALSMVVVWQLGMTLQALFALLLTWWLITLSLIDSEHHLLPDVLVIPGLWFGLILNSFGVFTSLSEALWGCVIGYVSLWSVFHLVKLCTGKESLGAGDFKLLALIGAWGGWNIVPLTLVLALLSALLANVQYLLRPKSSRPAVVPFGPHLSIAGWLSLALKPTLLHMM